METNGFIGRMDIRNLRSEKRRTGILLDRLEKQVIRVRKKNDTISRELESRSERKDRHGR